VKKLTGLEKKTGEKLSQFGKSSMSLGQRKNPFVDFGHTPKIIEYAF
jgi:hypothetical protein